MLTSNIILLISVLVDALCVSGAIGRCSGSAHAFLCLRLPARKERAN